MERKEVILYYANITIDKQKRLTLEVKPGLESIFSTKIPHGSSSVNHFEHIYGYLDTLDVSETMPFIRLYYSMCGKDDKLITTLSDEKQVLYGVKKENDFSISS